MSNLDNFAWLRSLYLQPYREQVLLVRSPGSIQFGKVLRENLSMGTRKSSDWDWKSGMDD